MSFLKSKTFLSLNASHGIEEKKAAEFKCIKLERVLFKYLLTNLFQFNIDLLLTSIGAAAWEHIEKKFARYEHEIKRNSQALSCSPSRCSFSAVSA